MNPERTSITSLLPKARLFNMNVLQEWCTSAQNMRNGSMLVACGMVRGVSAGTRSETIVSVVEAELAVGKAYKVSFLVKGEEWSTVCAC